MGAEQRHNGGPFRKCHHIAGASDEARGALAPGRVFMYRGYYGSALRYASGDPAASPTPSCSRLMRGGWVSPNGELVERHASSSIASRPRWSFPSHGLAEPMTQAGFL